MTTPSDAGFVMALGLDARRIRNAAGKPARASLKNQKNSATLAAHHARALLDKLSDEPMRVAASIALAALESIEQMAALKANRELLEAAREPAPQESQTQQAAA